MFWILDLPDDAGPPRVTEEVWPGRKAKRLMVWGTFDTYVAGLIQAKELRVEVRRRGMAALGDEGRSRVLRRRIDELLATAGAPSAR